METEEKYSKYDRIGDGNVNWQEKCLKEIENEDNVILSSPTGSGKTKVFLEWALKKKERPIFITAPIKALSNQRYRELLDEGYTVGIETGDVKNVPENCEFICCTQEIYTNKYAKIENATLIVDEFHYIFENPSRARTYIDALHNSKVKNILLCSATLGDVNKLKDYADKVSERDFMCYENDSRLTSLFFKGDIEPKDIKDSLIVTFSRKNINNIVYDLWKLRGDQDDEKIDQIVRSRDVKNYLYLIVNSDYGFTLQPALILASINYNDSDNIVEEKIKIVSKYLTKLLSWRVWNQNMISQSAMESTIYNLCKKIRNANIDELRKILKSSDNNLLELGNSPTLNRMNKNAIKVLLSLITELVARNVNESDYMLNKEEEIEIEHIWSNHYEEHVDEFENNDDFVLARNNIGDLLVLPRSFNRSYGDKPYTEKVKQYFSQNVLAQTLNEQKYKNNPAFLKFIKEANLSFSPYSKFTRKSISERAELYKEILKWNWR